MHSWVWGPSPRQSSVYDSNAISLLQIATETPPPRVSIHPEGVPAPTTPDGETAWLYRQAVQFFGALDGENRFSGARNVFRAVQAESYHVVSDRRCKADVRPLDATRSLALLRGVQPRQYRLLDGTRLQAGVLADEVPAEYTDALGGPGPHDRLAVDYNSLLAHLWNAVRDLEARVVALEGAGRGQGEERNAPPAPARP